MCLLGIEFRTLTEYPLLLLANREEAYSRPSSGPRIKPPDEEKPAWLGGTDLVAGGTWLGVNSHGLVAAVTNRKRQDLPAAPRSRGLLCRSLLAFASADAATRSAIDQLKSGHYAGCNLLIATPGSAAVIEFADELSITPLSPGLHLLTNDLLDDERDERIARVRRELGRTSPANADDWIGAAKRICGLGADGDQPPICLAGLDRGTVSSTIIALAQRAFGSRYWFADGPPNQTTYEDHTPLLCELLAGSTGASKSHRILLRGPWRCEPLARATRAPDGKIVWSQASLPPAASAHMPTTWNRLFGEFSGRVAFLRRFHLPKNLEANESVNVLIDGIPGDAEIFVNGRNLGRTNAQGGPWRHDVTLHLSVSNELRIELEVMEWSSATSELPLWRTVALDIDQATARS